MRFFKYLFLLITIALLTACPTHFEELEEHYYKDRYFNAATSLKEAAKDPKLKATADTFMERNGAYLKEKLISSIQYQFKNPQTEDVEQLKQLNKDLQDLSILYPDFFDDEFMTLSEKVHAQLLSQFSNKTIETVQSFLQAKRYRSAYEELAILKNQLVIPEEWVSTNETLENLVPRSLYVYPPKVHDLNVKDLRKEIADKQRFNYESAPSRLNVRAMNIPQVFKKYLKLHLNKYSSDYLSAGDADESDYHLQYRVGYHIDEDIIDSRQEVSSVFKVQYQNDPQWYEKELTYEVFIQSKQVHIIVDAQVILKETDQVIAHYIFESLVPQDKHKVGNIISDQFDIVNIDYPKEYSDYKYGIIDKPITRLIEDAIDDASLVLTFKVLDSIDTDPDPYLVYKNPTIIWPQ